MSTAASSSAGGRPTLLKPQTFFRILQDEPIEGVFVQKVVNDITGEAVELPTSKGLRTTYYCSVGVQEHVYKVCHMQL